jgi:ABC-type phosphate transport system permease subunit
MPAPESELPFDRRFRHALRAYRASISILVLAIGFLLTILALGAFTPLHTSDPFKTIDSSTDTASANYDLVFVIVGPILIIVGGYLVGAYFSARRAFEHLMLTKSKAEFLRNIPELEELLWDLTPKDQVRYEQRLSELRLRR